MGHVILLGDSIFDNAVYVPGELSVSEQLKNRMSDDWQTTLLAVDGDVTIDVSDQLKKLPDDASHLIVSVGGNDALQHIRILEEPARSSGEVLLKLSDIQDEFRMNYRRMLEEVLEYRLPVIVCTIYDQMPFPVEEAFTRMIRTTLSLFNDCIIREAARCGLGVLDLRLVCDKATHYSSISPIEPSFEGGERIADAIADIFSSNSFTENNCIVFSSSK